MRRLSLTVNICHALIVSTNIAVGLMIFRNGPFHGAINFVVAIGVAISSSYWRRNERRLQRARDQLNALRQEMDNPPNLEEAREANLKAAQNLVVVAKATGADLTARMDEARIRLGDSWFHLSHRHICRTRKDGSIESTCLTYGLYMPVAEEIAAALLLLKNDPKIFDRWKKQDHYYA